MTQPTYEHELFSLPFIFKNMDDDSALSALAMSGYHLKKYTAGEKIFDCESFEHSIAFIIDGEVSVYRAHSNKKTLLTKLQRGDSFGAAALFGAEESFPTSIYANKPSEIMYVSQSNIEKLIRAFPQIAINYIEFLSGRIRFLNDKIDSFASRSTEEKTAKFLLSNTRGDRLSSTLNMTQISSTLGIGRASLYRIFDSFEDMGLIERQNSEIIIKDREKLKNILKEKEPKK